MMIARAVSIAAGLAVAIDAQAMPAPVADYTFQNSLASGVTGAPDLAFIGAAQTYVSESVEGGAAQTVLSFAAGSGVALPTASSILPNAGIYTILLTVRHTNGSGFCKYVDFSGGAQDLGLYDHGGILQFKLLSGDSNDAIGSGYEEIAL